MTPDIGRRTAKKAKIIYPPPRAVDIITLIWGLIHSQFWTFKGFFGLGDSTAMMFVEVRSSLIYCPKFKVRFKRLKFGLCKTFRNQHHTTSQRILISPIYKSWVFLLKIWWNLCKLYLDFIFLLHFSTK